jgi:REP element-mobilizing transposase RayT
VFYNSYMANTIAYMVTWTTYGTWLQGDERRYVKDGETLLPDNDLAESNRQALEKEPVRFDKKHRQIVEDAIRQKAEQFGQQIHAIAVCSNHVHLLVSYIARPIEFVVQHYKAAGLMALRESGIQGKVWTKGFDKRYCFDQATLQKKIEYVNRHFLPKNI